MSAILNLQSNNLIGNGSSNFFTIKGSITFNNPGRWSPELLKKIYNHLNLSKIIDTINLEDFTDENFYIKTCDSIKDDYLKFVRNVRIFNISVDKLKEDYLKFVEKVDILLECPCTYIFDETFTTCNNIDSVEFYLELIDLIIAKKKN